jgi:hypothetical protein
MRLFIFTKSKYLLLGVILQRPIAELLPLSATIVFKQVAFNISHSRTYPSCEEEEISVESKEISIEVIGSG